MLVFLISRPSILNRSGQVAETSTAEPGITPEQVQAIRDRIRSRGRKIVASPITVVVNDLSATSTTTEATTTTTTTTTEANAPDVASEQPQVQQSTTTQQPEAVAVANAINDLGILSSVTEDPSGEFSLFPEGAIVLGVSSATEISEVIEIVNFTNQSA